MPRSRHSFVAVLVAAVLFAALPVSRAGAQATVSTGVRLVVPVSLSNLHPDVTKAGVSCHVFGGKVASKGLGEVLVPVTRNAIDTTLTVFIPVTLDASAGSPTGTTSNWTCEPVGWTSAIVPPVTSERLRPNAPVQLKVDHDATQSGTVTW